ncbi:phosphoesterase RecJ-like protein [Kutzneria viridogrisea]|uniref:Phosphoesterase RecJ-like protein n=1 Tax=Kutzneria viridogrisea TaxID=47990 RepID=A0ABR6BFS7_9PSEU|nr:bifunctional oligoribonuclease/PAP phosphatase NrnA [Kutzneria albida]MBA8925739.1 phosphoesterase RecJ-like protein [Kutzneria viridogrisea]
MSVSVDDQIAAAVPLLATAEDVTLLAHVNPDADALGSALALGLALHRRGARVRVSFGGPEQTPESLRGLDSAGLIVPAEAVPAAPPLLVALDTGSVDRLGALADRVAATTEAGGTVLVVDHHVSNTRYGTHHVVDDRAEATAVLVLRLLDALDVPLDEPIARCLYAGLATDTVSFRFAGPAAHRSAARLLESGVDAPAMLRQLMDSHPFGWLHMLSTVLGRAQLEPEAAQGVGLVHTHIRLADHEGLRAEEVESVVDVVRTTAEAGVAAVFKEFAQGEWTVSLRSTGALDVRSAAQRLGGGGHRMAAGFTAYGEPGQVLAELRAALDQATLL